MRITLSACLLAAVLSSAPALATSTVGVVDGNCISVAHTNGCLFTGNIANGTVGDTQSAYNLYNDTHPTADPDIVLTHLFDSNQGGFPGNVTNSGGSSGTWSTPGFLINFIAVKASNAFVLYKLAAPASSGNWDTFQIPFNRNPHDLSHLSFFGAAVPEPASWAMLLTGFGMVGAMRRRRRMTVSA
ncbi:PEPxxWA-CTERM sorting domain-containing protein [Sandarakinorhabdus sp.]|uniref:PEPxxWA-CTERM sorting domain-containing protein n=1 Tax=Sandarakinorhabdus sp. TaxID=1916663 RepID=UPI00286E15A1|nr:PEPxxWA-CTERM sorting domain-containing protein [Sandarakinorhabdus sp.]